MYDKWYHGMLCRVIFCYLFSGFELWDALGGTTSWARIVEKLQFQCQVPHPNRLWTHPQAVNWRRRSYVRLDSKKTQVLASPAFQVSFCIILKHPCKVKPLENHLKHFLNRTVWIFFVVKNLVDVIFVGIEIYSIETSDVSRLSLYCFHRSVVHTAEKTVCSRNTWKSEGKIHLQINGTASLAIRINAGRQRVIWIWCKILLAFYVF